MKKYILFETLIRDFQPMVLEHTIYLPQNDETLIQGLTRIADKSGNIFIDASERDGIIEELKQSCAMTGHTLRENVSSWSIKKADPK